MSKLPETKAEGVPFDRRPLFGVGPKINPDWYADPLETGYPPKLGQRCKLCMVMNGGLYMRGSRLVRVGVRTKCQRCGCGVSRFVGALPEDARAFVRRVDGRECAPGGATPMEGRKA